MTMIARARLLLALAVICRSQASSVTGASADACPLEHYETSFLQVHKAVKFASDRSGEGVFAKEELAEQVPEILTNVHEEVKSWAAPTPLPDGPSDEHMAGKAFIYPSTQSGEGGSIADEADSHVAGKTFINPSSQSGEGGTIADEDDEPMAGKAFINPSSQSGEGGSIADKADKHMAGRVFINPSSQSGACRSIAEEDDEDMAGKAFIDPSTQSDFSGWQIAEEAEESISADIEKAFNQVKLPGLVAKLGRLKDKVLGKIHQALSTLGHLTTRSKKYMRSPDGQKVVLKTMKAAAGLTLFVAGTFFSGGLAPALLPALSVGSNILFSALEARHAQINSPDDSVTRADVAKMFIVNVLKGGLMMTIGFEIDNPFDGIDATPPEAWTNAIIGFADMVCGTANDWIGGGKADYQGTTVKDEVIGQVSCLRPSLYKSQGEEGLLEQFVDQPEFGADELQEPHFCEVKRKELEAIRAEFEQRADAPPRRRGAVINHAVSGAVPPLHGDAPTESIKDSVERETAALKKDPNWKPPSWGQ